MKYKVESYQVVYRSGARDKITLLEPIITYDLWSVRTKLVQKHTAPGVAVAGINFNAKEVGE